MVLLWQLKRLEILFHSNFKYSLEDLSHKSQSHIRAVHNNLSDYINKMILNTLGRNTLIPLVEPQA